MRRGFLILCSGRAGTHHDDDHDGDGTRDEDECFCQSWNGSTCEAQRPYPGTPFARRRHKLHLLSTFHASTNWRSAFGPGQEMVWRFVVYKRVVLHAYQLLARSATCKSTHERQHHVSNPSREPRHLRPRSHKVSLRQLIYELLKLRAQLSNLRGDRSMELRRLCWIRRRWWK